MDRLVLSLTMVLMAWRGERDASIVGDDLGNQSDAQGDGCVVVTLRGRGDHCTADVPYLGVVQDAFEAVANLDAAFARRHDEDHQDASIGSFRTYLPLVLEGGGELFDRHVVVDGFDGNDGYLGVSLAVDLDADVFDVLLDGGGKDACKIIDEAGRRRECADLFGG